MKARLSQWGFNVLAFSLATMAWVARLMPEPAPVGRHRGVGRATRASHRALAKQRDLDAWKRQAFAELGRVKPKILVWDGDVGMITMNEDEFDIPPLPQRRFRALAPRALAASAIDAREALRRDQEALQQDQEAIAGDFDRAVASLTTEREVS